MKFLLVSESVISVPFKKSLFKKNIFFICMVKDWFAAGKIRLIILLGTRPWGSEGIRRSASGNPKEQSPENNFLEVKRDI